MNWNLKGLAVIVVLAAAVPTMASADVATGYIDLNSAGGPSDYEGDVVFTLQSDGTVDALLNVTNGDNIRSFGIGSSTHVDQSNFSDPEAQDGGAVSVGPNSYLTTVHCGGDGCSPQMSWTIGDTGEFTSVAQLFTGYTPSLPPIILNAGGIRFAEVIYSAAPEPATWSLMLLGIGGVGATMRSRRKAALVAI
jgi:hypothetical protein